MRTAKFWLVRVGLPCVIILLLLLVIVLGSGLLSGASNQAQIEQNARAAPVGETATPSLSGSTTLKNSEPAAPASTVSNITEVPATCAADGMMQQQLKHILQQRKQHSYQLIQQLQTTGTQAADIAIIVHQLGGDMVLLAQNRSDYPVNPNTLIRFEQQPRAIPRALALIVLRATLSQNYQSVFAALQADAAPQHLAWHGQTLLTAILASDPQLSPLTLQQLIDSGLQPTFADLVAATALQLPVALVDTLNMAFSGDRQQLWFHQYRRNNLTLQAAADGNVALYDYWLAEGVPALISAADLNAFDLLPFPATEAELLDRLPVIRSFIKQGLLPRQFTNLTSWLLLLPKDDALQLSQQLAGTDQKTQVAAINLTNIQEASVISDAIIDINQKFKQHIGVRQHCNQLYQLGSVLLLLDDADQNYGAALKARFRVNAAQIEATIHLLSQQQQLELLLETQQWQAFVRQAQQQLVMLTPEQRSNYVLEQLLHYQAPAEVLMLQLQRHHRRFGLPPADMLAALQQNKQPQLHQQLRRFPWWQRWQQTQVKTRSL